MVLMVEYQKGQETQKELMDSGQSINQWIGVVQSLNDDTNVFLIHCHTQW